MGLRALTLPALSGIALWLSFPGFSLFPLAWLALVPFLEFCTREKSLRRILVGHLVMGGIYFGGTLSWILNVLTVYGKLDPAVSAGIFGLLLVIQTAFLLPFTVLTALTARVSPKAALWAAPGFWILTELLRTYFPFGGFPWASLGYSQLPYLWIVQIADVGSVYLVSFLVVSASSAILAFWKWRSWSLGGVFLSLFLAANLYGFYRVEVWSPEESESLRAGLVQGVIELSAPAEHYAERYFEALPHYFDKAVKQGARLVIFPEAQNPYFFPDNFYFRTFWERRVMAANAYLLFNSASFDESGVPGYFNSVHLLDPEGRAVYRYDKNHLVPFGEYLPWAGILGFSEALVAEVSGFKAGSGSEVGTMDGVKIGTLICYEVIFPELSREAVNKGANVLINLTNDGWFGRTAAPSQHLQMAAFRCIENRKPMLRAANSGYSAVIDPSGAVRVRTELYEETLLMTEVKGNSVRTLFGVIGSWICIAIIILSLGIFAAAGKRREGANS